ncbi:Toxin RelE [Tumidithrix helvetica PCC 7403]|uniref:type II toxin-antitoxin system HigB family toxin n=1 Tax=Tumidithrix helvetica TaxID=3457545 RepID=UPI003CA753E5
MHIIAKKTLREFFDFHADSKSALDSWYQVVSKAKWQHISDVRKVYPSADAVGNFTVFNINGNKYRLIVSINYKNQVVFIKYVLTHTEYDSGTWKNDPYFK